MNYITNGRERLERSTERINRLLVDAFPYMPNRTRYVDRQRPTSLGIFSKSLWEANGNFLSKSRSMKFIRCPRRVLPR
jgi:hypothetical protein